MVQGCKGPQGAPSRLPTVGGCNAPERGGAASGAPSVLLPQPQRGPHQVEHRGEALPGHAAGVYTCGGAARSAKVRQSRGHPRRPSPPCDPCARPPPWVCPLRAVRRRPAALRVDSALRRPPSRSVTKDHSTHGDSPHLVLFLLLAPGSDSSSRGSPASGGRPSAAAPPACWTNSILCPAKRLAGAQRLSRTLNEHRSGAAVVWGADLH